MILWSPKLPDMQPNMLQKAIEGAKNGPFGAATTFLLSVKNYNYCIFFNVSKLTWGFFDVISERVPFDSQFASKAQIQDQKGWCPPDNDKLFDIIYYGLPINWKYTLKNALILLIIIISIELHWKVLVFSEIFRFHAHHSSPGLVQPYRTRGPRPFHISHSVKQPSVVSLSYLNG